MKDYCDGIQYKEHLLFPHALQIMLYYDEVEMEHQQRFTNWVGIPVCVFA